MCTSRYIKVTGQTLELIWRTYITYLEQCGGHEDGTLGEVDVLGVVEPLAELPHGARVGRPPEDAHRRRTLRHYLEQH